MRRFEHVPTIYVLSKNMKKVKFFHQNIIVFTAMKYCRILHGHVCVMYALYLFFCNVDPSWFSEDCLFKVVAFKNMFINSMSFLCK